MPERDERLALLRDLERADEAAAAELAELDELYAEVGTFLTARLTFRLEQRAVEDLRERLRQPPASVAGLAVIEVNRLDGVKMILEDGSWLLFRLSGMEPVVRLYAEASTQELLDRLITAGEVLAGR